MISYHSCVHRCSTFNFLQQHFCCILHKLVTCSAQRPNFWPVLIFDVFLTKLIHLFFSMWYSLHFLDLSEWFLSHVKEVFGYYLLEYFFCLLLSLFSFWHLYNTVRFMLSQSSLRLSSFVFNLFSLFCSASVISTSLSSTSLIHCSASCILLLAASNEFSFQLLYFASVLT